MIDERIYRLNNGEEKVLLTRAPYREKKYLLLSDKITEEVEVGYEEDGKLVTINKNYPDFSKILEILYNKLKEEN